MSELIPTAQAARLLGVNPSTVWRMAEAGQLRVALFVEARRMRLFDISDVRELAEKRKALATARA